MFKNMTIQRLHIRTINMIKLSAINTFQMKMLMTFSVIFGHLITGSGFFIKIEFSNYISADKLVQISVNGGRAN